MSVTIYHNQSCGTSRNVLAMIRNAGIEPTIIEYLKTPPTREVLRGLIDDAGLSVRAALRERGTPYHELGLGDPALTDDQLLDAMMAHPILINRPFVVTPLESGCAAPRKRSSTSFRNRNRGHSLKRTVRSSSMSTAIASDSSISREGRHWPRV